MSVQDSLDLVSSSATTLVKTEKGESEYLLSGFRLAVVMSSFMGLVSLSGLDQTVLATALVTITSRFNAVSDIAWITSVFFIVQSCFMLLYGKVLNIAPPKLVIIISSGLFVLGSLLCAIAPSVETLIAGRVVAGFGATGVWLSILSIIGRISDISVRPILIGSVASAYGFCSIIGPIVGGVFTERVSWRWCFYINIPIGALGILMVMIYVPNLPSLTVHKKSILDTWLQLDWIGATLNVIGVCLLLVGLQLGGNIKPWNNAGVIVTIILGTIFLCLFVAWEVRKGPEAILPTTMFRRRNVVGSFLITACLHWTLVLISFYMPIVYQLRGHSVIRSSIEILPFIGAGIVGGALSGVSVALTRHVWIWLFFPPFLGTVAFALLATSTINTSLAALAGYQILIGFGLGATVQNCIVVVQAEYADQEDLVPQATSLVTFGGLMFSAIGTATLGALFSSVLRSEVQKLHLNLSPSLQTLVLENIDAVLALPETLRSPLINAYLTAVKRSFLCGVAVNTFGGLSALAVERKRIPAKKPPYAPNVARNRDSRFYQNIYQQYEAEPWLPLLH